MKQWRTVIIPVLLLLAGPVLPLSAATGHTSGISPDDALAKLKKGNEMFLKGESNPGSWNLQRRKYTAGHGQQPYATIVGCSDSREPLEHIFTAGVGDIFVIRVAGNVADTDEIGSIEYGVAHLGTPVLLILGHTHCGAVTAVVKGDPVEGSIPPLVDNIIPAVLRAKKAKGETVSEELIHYAVKENVYQSMSDVLQRSPETAALVREGKLTLQGAIYDIESGRIDWLGEHPQQARLLAAPSWLKKLSPGSILSMLVAAILPALFLLLVFKALVAEKRMVRFIRMKGRIFSAFSGLITASLGMLLLLMRLEKSLGLLEVGIVAGVVLLFAAVFAFSIIGSMRKAINALKKSSS